MMRSPFSRLPLLAKILLSTSVAITVLFGITGEIVLTHIGHTAYSGSLLQALKPV